MKYLAKLLAKKIKSISSTIHFLSLKVKSTVLLLTIFTVFSKIDGILGEIPENVNKNNGKFVYYSQNFKPRQIPVKTKSKKKKLFTYSALERLFNDTTPNSVQ